MDACDKSARRIKRDAKRRRSEPVGAPLLLRIITACPPSAFFAPQRVCCKRPTEKKHHSPVIYRAWPPRLIFSLPPYPTAIPLYFFYFFCPFFPFDKASYPSQSGKPGELRPPIDGDMARLHRFSAVIQASSSSDLLSKPRSDRIACGIRQPSIASQSLRSPPTLPKTFAPRGDDYLTLLSSASGAVEMRISQIASGRTSGWGWEGCRLPDLCRITGLSQPKQLYPVPVFVLTCVERKNVFPR